MAKYKASLLRDGVPVWNHIPITIDETYEPGSSLPTFVGSIYSESWPEFQPGDQFRLVLEDGRSADIFAQQISHVTDGLYRTTFYFSSELQQ